MKKGMLLFVATTMLYMLCGCIGYAAFGDNAAEKLVEAANAAIAIHSVHINAPTDDTKVIRNN